MGLDKNLDEMSSQDIYISDTLHYISNILHHEPDQSRAYILLSTASQGSTHACLSLVPKGVCQ